MGQELQAVLGLPVGVVLALASALAVAAVAMLIYHLRDCGQARRRIEARLDRIETDVAYMRGKMEG